MFANLTEFVPKLLLLSASGVMFSQVTSPVNSPPAKGILVEILFVIVVEKFASSPTAAANSLRVLRALGDESTKFDTAVSVYAVVAIFVLPSP